MVQYGRMQRMGSLCLFAWVALAAMAAAGQADGERPVAPADPAPKRVLIEVKIAEVKHARAGEPLADVARRLGVIDAERQEPKGPAEETLVAGAVQAILITGRGDGSFETNDLAGSDSSEEMFARLIQTARIKAVIAGLEQTAGIDLLSAPQVMTLDRREASLKVSETRQIAIALIEGQNVAKPMEFGPEILVAPVVLPGNGTVGLEVHAKVREFLGYLPAAADQTLIAPVAEADKQRSPKPQILECGFSGTATMKNGETLVMGGAIVTPSNRADKKTGPARSRWFFITPRIVE